MSSKNYLLAIVPALCAILIALRLTVFKPSHTSDLSLGLTTGVLLALSFLSVVFLRRKTA